MARGKTSKPAKKIDPTGLFGVKDVQATLGVSRQFVKRMVNERRLPDIRTGKRHLWTGAQLLKAVGTAAETSEKEEVINAAGAATET